MRPAPRPHELSQPGVSVPGRFPPGVGCPVSVAGRLQRRRQPLQAGGVGHRDPGHAVESEARTVPHEHTVRGERLPQARSLHQSGAGECLRQRSHHGATAPGGPASGRQGVERLVPNVGHLTGTCKVPGGVVRVAAPDRSGVASGMKPELRLGMHSPADLARRSRPLRDRWPRRRRSSERRGPDRRPTRRRAAGSPPPGRGSAATRRCGGPQASPHRGRTGSGSATDPASTPGPSPAQAPRPAHRHRGARRQAQPSLANAWIRPYRPSPHSTSGPVVVERRWLPRPGVLRPIHRCQPLGALRGTRRRLPVSPGQVERVSGAKKVRYHALVTSRAASSTSTVVSLSAWWANHA